MSNRETVPETTGVTSDVLATIDLSAEIDGMAGSSSTTASMGCIAS